MADAAYGLWPLVIPNTASRVRHPRYYGHRPARQPDTHTSAALPDQRAVTETTPRASTPRAT